MIKHCNFQYFSKKSYVVDRYFNLLTAAILVHTHFSFRFDLSGAFLNVLLEGFVVGLLNAVVGVHVDEGFGLLLFGAFNHKLDFLFLFRQLKWKNSNLIPYCFFSYIFRSFLA